LNRKLLELARLYRIQPFYLDATQQRHDADPEALLLVLRAMGAGVNRMDDVPRALRQRREDLRSRTEPVMVAWDGKLGHHRFGFGYHEVEMKGRRVFVISTPVKAYFPGAPKHSRLWGIFAPAYALNSKRNPHAGDLGDFEHFMQWMAGLGGTVAGTLPLLGAFLNKPFDPSPYLPATRLFWNEFYIDLQRIPEFSGNSPIDRLKKTKFIDYRNVMAAKRRVLEKLSRAFFVNAPVKRLQAFRKFVRENTGVEDYARFRAVVDRQNCGWRSWPARLRDGAIRRGDYDEATKNYHLYSQWIIQEQLEGLSDRAAARGQFLYLDLPLGLHPESYDTWRDRDFFVEDIAGGAPPDRVFTTGQNWGFPPMNPEAMRLNRYQYIIAYLRNHLRFAKLLRIDHVMGLHRLYWIPDELTGDKGVYVTYPAEELWAILSLESHRHRVGIVGENLGMVPPPVNKSMKKHDIRQMYVVQYEAMGNPDNPSLSLPPRKCVASINTHDMPPFRAFLDGSDIDDRLDLGFIDEKTALQERRQRKLMRSLFGKLGNGLNLFTRVTQFLSDSSAEIVLVNIEDLWDETLSQNVPATNTERPNWRRRFRPSLEQIRKMARVAEVLSNVFAQRSRSVSV
jgi:4-alpha-glucanotransferase